MYLMLSDNGVWLLLAVSVALTTTLDLVTAKPRPADRGISFGHAIYTALRRGDSQGRNSEPVYCNEPGYDSGLINPCGIAMTSPNNSTDIHGHSCRYLANAEVKLRESHSYGVDFKDRYTAVRLQDPEYVTGLQNMDQFVYHHGNLTAETEHDSATGKSVGAIVFEDYTRVMEAIVFLEQARYQEQPGAFNSSFQQLVTNLQGLQCELYIVLYVNEVSLPPVPSCDVLTSDMVNVTSSLLRYSRDYVLLRDVTRFLEVLVEKYTFVIHENGC